MLFQTLTLHWQVNMHLREITDLKGLWQNNSKCNSKTSLSHSTKFYYNIVNLSSAFYITIRGYSDNF